MEEQVGETINDAVFDANLAVASRFNINFEWVPINERNYDAYKIVVQQVQADEDAYDFVTLHDTMSVTAMLSGVLENVNSIGVFDYSKPWWPQFTVEALTVNGKMYHICNSLSYYGLASTRALFINLDMAEDMGIASPYDMVRNGTWTMDVLIGLTKDTHTDVNGDGIKDLGDKYGFALTGAPYDYLEGFGIDVYGKTEDKKEIVLDFYNDNVIKAIEQSCQWIWGGSPGVYYKSKHGGYFKEDSALTMFGNGNVLFSYNSIERHVQACADSSFTYGILPQPKLDENQTEYFGGCVDNPICIPTTNSDLERTGIIIEAMSAEGYKQIQPAYVEIALKNRYASDKDSVEMLEIIFANRLLSSGYLFGTASGLQMAHEAMWKTETDQPAIASSYETRRPTDQAKIDSINEFFAKTEE